MVARPVTQLDLREEPYDGAAARRLTDEVQQEYVVRYGGPDTAPVDPSEFAAPHGRFVVGYVDGAPVAMGGIRTIAPGVAEVKRMYVARGMRRRGLSRAVLSRLEDLARDVGAVEIVLETGRAQPEAMRLYETSGYQQISGFGHYRDADGAVSYGKSLPGPATAP
jgi:GNAT superfamily N-acetyltransferase